MCLCAVRDQRSSTSHNDNVDVANSDNDAASCSDSTPGGSRHCGVVATATVARSPPPYDVIVDCSSEGYCNVTLTDQQVRVSAASPPHT